MKTLSILFFFALRMAFGSALIFSCFIVSKLTMSAPPPPPPPDDHYFDLFAKTFILWGSIVFAIATRPRADHG